MNETYIYKSPPHWEKKNKYKAWWLRHQMNDLSICRLNRKWQPRFTQSLSIHQTRKETEKQIYMFLEYFTQKILQAGGVHCAYFPLWFEQVVTSVNIFSWLWISDLWWHPFDKVHVHSCFFMQFNVRSVLCLVIMKSTNHCLYNF